LVEASLVNSYQKVSFLAASAPHSGDWLFALPISSCGLRLDDEAVRIAVGMRLGFSFCVPRVCRCGAFVALCTSMPIAIAFQSAIRQHIFKEVVATAFILTGIPDDVLR